MSQGKESQTTGLRKVTVEDDPEAMESFLELLYGAEIREKASLVTVCRMHTLADKYLSTNGKIKCETWLGRKIAFLWNSEEFLEALEGICDGSEVVHETVKRMYYSACTYNLAKLLNKPKFSTLVLETRELHEAILTHLTLKEGESQVFCLSCDTVLTVQGHLSRCTVCRSNKFREVAGYAKAQGKAVAGRARAPPPGSSFSDDELIEIWD